MREAVSWRVVVEFKSYQQARTFSQLALFLDQRTVRFVALDADGEPIVSDERQRELNEQRASA